MSSRTAYQAYLKQCDVDRTTQSYRIDAIPPFGWSVRIDGRAIIEVDTREEAQRWLAGFLLLASTTEESPEKGEE